MDLNLNTMNKIKIIRNPENKTLKEIVDKELNKKEVKPITWADLKLTKNKEITDKYSVWYLDYLLLSITDSYTESVIPMIDSFLDNISYFERKGYNVDLWLKKYNIVMNRRNAVKGNYL